MLLLDSMTDEDSQVLCAYETETKIMNRYKIIGNKWCLVPLGKSP